MTNKTTSIPVRFTPEEKAAIEALAADEDRNVSGLIRRAVNVYLRSQGAYPEVQS